MATRLLIVDDEIVLCDSLRRVLLKEGYEVDSVYSSETALERMREKPYDVIVSDIFLPDLNGLELLEMCRNYNPNLVSIVMTAYASIDTVVASIKKGAAEYLIKPIDHEQLKAVIHQSVMENPNKLIAR